MKQSDLLSKLDKLETLNRLCILDAEQYHIYLQERYTIKYQILDAWKEMQHATS